MAEFKIETSFTPKGDQPSAIHEITNSLNANEPYTTLLGITGSGKTFTMANVIQSVNRPTLIMSHNKTLAAQLYGDCLLYTSPSPRDIPLSRMPSSA